MPNNWAEWDKEHGRGGGGERSADKLAAMIKGTLGSTAAPAPSHGSHGSVVHQTTKRDLKRPAPVKGEKDQADSMRTRIRMAEYQRRKAAAVKQDPVDKATPKVEQKVNPHEPRPAGPTSTAAQRAGSYSHQRAAARVAEIEAKDKNTHAAHVKAAQEHREAARLSPNVSQRTVHQARAKEHEDAAVRATSAARLAEQAKAGPTAEQKANHYKILSGRAQMASETAKTASEHRTAARAHERAAELAPTSAHKLAHQNLAENHTKQADLEDRAEALAATKRDAAEKAARERAAASARETAAAKERVAARQGKSSDDYAAARRNAISAEAKAGISKSAADRQAAANAHTQAAVLAHTKVQRDMHTARAADMSKPTTRSEAPAVEKTAPARSANKIASQAQGNRTIEQEVEALRQEHPNVRLQVNRSSSGHVVVRQIVVPQERRSQGIGSKIMKRLTDAADRNGDQMALTPSKDYGGTVSRLQKFYRGHGFVPNSGRNKDYTIRESMIREPKRAAAPKA